MVNRFGIKRAMALLLMAALVIGTMPAASTKAYADETDSSIATSMEEAMQADVAAGRDPLNPSRIRVRSVVDWDDMMIQLKKLEEYVDAWKVANSNSTDRDLLMAMYIRSSRYATSSWSYAGGTVPTGLVDYIAGQDTANSTDVQSLRSMGNLPLPNGETTDPIHMFATLNCILNSTSGYTMGDLGGWLGDTCDLLQDIHTGTYADVDAAITAAQAKFNISGGFGPADAVADLDAYNIYYQYIEDGESLYDAVEAYEVSELTEKERVQTFAESRLSGVAITKTDYRDAVYDAYTGNLFIIILESSRGLSGTTYENARKGACYTVADYIYKYVAMPEITTISLADGMDGTVYSEALTATGDTPITWSVESGSLPAGLTLDPTTGVISGTPTVDGSFTVEFKATNAEGSDSKTYTITIDPDPNKVAPVITTVGGDLTEGTVGSAYFEQIEASSSDAVLWSVSSGSLPDGLSLDPATGIISGTPTKGETALFTIMATNSYGSSTINFEITVVVPTATPSVATPSNPTPSTPSNGSPSGGHSSSGGGTSSADTGRWVYDGIGWWYNYGTSRSWPAKTWKRLAYNGRYDWYYFGEDGYIKTGWFYDNGLWYFLNNIADGYFGAMKTGWIQDGQDGRWYYMDPSTGQMLIGEQVIDGKTYRFNAVTPQNSGWSMDAATGEWIYDAVKADMPIGAWIEE